MNIPPIYQKFFPENFPQVVVNSYKSSYINHVVVFKTIMGHDSLEDLMMEAERLGIRDEVYQKVSKMKRKGSNKHTSDVFEEAFDKVNKKNKRKRTS